MKLKILSSGSSGNGYIIHNDTEALLLECGVRFKEVQVALDFNISKINGCILTHCHGDHSKYINEYLDKGINVWTSTGTIHALNIKSRFLPLMCEEGNKFKVGNFTILPFGIIHDAPEPLGFLIHHPECGRVLFLTDSFYSEYRFANLNFLLIEANFCEHILQQNIESGKLNQSVRRRIEQSHMSIQVTKELLKANDLSKVQNIVLIHLSSGNSNAKQFQSEVEALTGLPTTIADKGIEVNFNLNSF